MRADKEIIDEINSERLYCSDDSGHFENIVCIVAIILILAVTIFCGNVVYHVGFEGGF